MNKKWLIKKYKARLKEIEDKIFQLYQERLVVIMDIEYVETEDYDESTLYKG